MTRILASIALAALLLPLATVQAQDGKAYRTAYVDMQTIFEGYYKTVQANITFANEKRDFLDRLKLLEGELRPLLERAQTLQAQLKDDLLSEDIRKNAARDLRMVMDQGATRQQEYLRFRQEGRARIEEKRLQAEGKLIEDLTDFVRKYCEMNGYHIVYDINGKSLNRMPVLLLYPKELEITEELAKAVNRGHEAELAKAQEDLKAIEATLAQEVDDRK